MTQDEVIKLAAEAGFKWPDICETTIEQRLGRFANLIAVAEREKCTGTQEFVTLPREVVEQALEALINEGEFRKLLKPLIEKSIDSIRAALEQPQNHVPDAGNMVPAGWKLVPVEPNCGMVLAGERSLGQHDFLRLDSAYRAMLAAAPQPTAVEQQQPEQELVAWMTIEVTGPRTRVDVEWEDQLQKLPPGIYKIYTNPQPTALEQPPSDQPAMTPIAQRKLDSLLTEGYTISGYSIYNEQKHQHGFVTGAGLVGWWKPEGMEYPQPRGEPSTVAFCHVGDVVVCDNDSLLRRLGVKRSDKLYLHPQDLNCKSKQALLATLWGYTKEQPKRPPLTDNQIDKIAESMPGGLEGFLKGWGWRQFARAVLENDHNIK